MSINTETPFKLQKRELYVAIRLAPGASRNAIGRVEIDGAGKARLKVMVTAVPEGGKANASLIKLLAKAWKLPPGIISVATGATNRNKRLVISNGDSALVERLENWLETRSD